MIGKREYGDYQTPPAFADKVCEFLKNKRGVKPEIVLEPTCGIGNFLKSSNIFNASQYYGIEINPQYCKECENKIGNDKTTIINSDFFKFDLSFLKKEKLLVIGNPPWANNSMLSAFGSGNLPPKTNFKGHKGLDAITGASNFDICEYIILRLAKEYINTDTVIAMLCKTSVARNVFVELERYDVKIARYEIIEFNAAKIFGINADACLLFIQMDSREKSSRSCKVYSFENIDEVKRELKYENGRIIDGSISRVDDFDGRCCFQWRQGVKHDCAKVMELAIKENGLVNGNKENVDIEEKLVYPLVKSSMFKMPIIDSFSKKVIVTQRKTREDTSYIEFACPKTWAYLCKNRGVFEQRKSSIYRGAPDFSMFGVGEYSYEKYKVGVSGFYKKPMFAVLYSPDGKPVMTDDTSYFICLSSYDNAYVAMLYLNSERVQTFLNKIAFLDTKRPFTKKVLERVDFEKICQKITFEEIQQTEMELGLERYVTVEMVKNFLLEPGLNQKRFA